MHDKTKGRLMRGLLALLVAHAAVACSTAARDAKVAPSFPRGPEHVCTVQSEAGESPVPVGPTDPSWGCPGADATLVVFGDYECIVTAAFLIDAVDWLKYLYGPEQLRVVWKDYPLSDIHRNAQKVAELGQRVFATAGAEAFWRFQRYALQHQDQLGADPFKDWVRFAGVAPEKLWPAAEGDARHAPDQASAREAVAVDLKLAETLGVRSTPTLFVNGVRVNGLRRPEDLERLIQEEIAAATTVRKGGAPREQWYAQRSSERFQQPTPEYLARPMPTQEEAANPGGEAAESQAGEPLREVAIEVGDSPARGPKQAPVTIVVFSDFQCPFCARGEEVLAAVRGKFSDKVRVVWKHMPLSFHDQAGPAARLAEAARVKGGDAAFWRVHDALFAAQAELGRPLYEGIARQVGLDAQQLDAILADPKGKARIMADMEQARRLGIQGTPTFVVNGKLVEGALPEAEFFSLIELVLAEAKAAGKP